MKTFTSKLILPLLATLTFGAGLTTEASAMEKSQGYRSHLSAHPSKAVSPSDRSPRLAPRYTLERNAFVTWDACAQEPQTCDELDSRECRRLALDTCRDDSDCVGFALRHEIGQWDDFVTYSDETCVEKNTYPDRHWNLYKRVTDAPKANVIHPRRRAIQAPPLRRTLSKPGVFRLPGSPIRK